MQREIIFKAKRKDNGEWVYGQIVYDKDKIPFIIEEVERESNDEETDLYAITWYEVIPETICQDTGLKDKNGVKVFENDIVNGITGKPNGDDLIINNMQVTFDYMDLVMLDHTDDLEVIGNIFDKEVK